MQSCEWRAEALEQFGKVLPEIRGVVQHPRDGVAVRVTVNFIARGAVDGQPAIVPFRWSQMSSSYPGFGGRVKHLDTLPLHWVREIERTPPTKVDSVPYTPPLLTITPFGGRKLSAMVHFCDLCSLVRRRVFENGILRQIESVTIPKDRSISVVLNLSVFYPTPKDGVLSTWVRVSEKGVSSATWPALKEKLVAGVNEFLERLRRYPHDAHNFIEFGPSAEVMWSGASFDIIHHVISKL